MGTISANLLTGEAIGAHLTGALGKSVHRIVKSLDRSTIFIALIHFQRAVLGSFR